MNSIRAYLAVPLIRRGVTFAALALLGLFAAAYWLWSPAQAAHQFLKQDVIALQSMKLIDEARVDATESFAQTVGRIAVLEAKLVAPIDRAGVVEIMADLSRQTQVQIIHGANTFGRPRGAVRPVLQDLTVEGSYSEVSDFLGRLGQVETLTLLRRAEFTTNADGTLVRAQLKLMTLNDRPGQ